MRKDMSPEEKETIDALLDGFHAEFLSNVAKVHLFYNFQNVPESPRMF